MKKTGQETIFSEKTIKFRPHIVCMYIYIPFNLPRRLLKGWDLFPLHPVYFKTAEWVRLLYGIYKAVGFRLYFIPK